MERRLTVILAADVVGYSRMIRADEEGTLLALRKLRSDVIDPKIEKHRGRIVKLMGDGILIEFASVVDAVLCGSQVQLDLAERNIGKHKMKQIIFRVGVNLGDVVIDGDDIQGDGVNVAARLEGISEPGGMCISDAVYEQVRDRLELTFEDLGDREIKNIDRPVRAWVWSGTKSNASPISGSDRKSPPLPDKPSIAVLPFNNMSGDPEQEYFVDGVVEDILTTLSKIPALFVIARNSSFQYKGKSPDIREVGRELGVRYVVEGSVRKAGNRVRVTAQLIDCSDGKHIWADRYDGELDDVFDLQDRLTREIVTKLEVNLTEGEQVSLWRKRSGSPLVYETFIKGRDIYTKFSRQTHNLARAEFEEALKINPTFTPAIVMLGYTLADQARYGWAPDREVAFQEALELAGQAIALDPDYSLAHTVTCYVYTFQQRHDEAVAAADKAISLSHNDATVFHMAAITNIFAGNFRIGREYEIQHGRLSPIGLQVSLVEMARAQFHLMNYEEAQKITERVLGARPRWLTALTILLASYWYLDNKVKARELAATIQDQHPNFSVGRWSKAFPYRNTEDLKTLMNPLLEAGLPE